MGEKTQRRSKRLQGLEPEAPPSPRDYIPLEPHLEEEEIKAEEAREEEAEAKTEVEETVQQMLKGEATIQIRTKAKETANKEDNIMLKDKGMKNPMSNVIIVKNMGIMPVNVGRSSMM